MFDWRPIKTEWLFDVYILQTIQQSNQMDAEFANWLKNRHQKFHDNLTKDVKLINIQPTAPEYHKLNFPVLSHGSFNKSEFVVIFNQCLIRGNVIEDFKMAEVKKGSTIYLQYLNNSEMESRIDQKIRSNQKNFIVLVFALSLMKFYPFLILRILLIVF